MGDSVAVILNVALVTVSGLAVLLVDSETGSAVTRQSARESQHVSPTLIKTPMVRMKNDTRAFYADESGTIHFNVSSAVANISDPPIKG